MNIIDKYLQFLIIFIIIASGAFYIRTVWLRFEDEQNSKIMQIGKSIVATLPQNIINSLSSKPSDINTSQYKELKKTLSAITLVNEQTRFAYLFSKQNGKLYFIADSEPDGTKAASPPGQEYVEATPIDDNLFDENSVPVIEQSTDRWGEWMSVLVPVKDRVSGKTIAVFGMDFENKSWNYRLFLELAQPAIVTLLLLLSFYFLFIIKKKNQLLKNDIKNLLKIEQALRESQSLYLSLIEQLPNAVFRKDFEGRYILVNSQFCKLKGLNLEDFIGKKPLLITSKEIELHGEQWEDTIYANADEDIHRQILRTGALVKNEEVYPTADGRKKYMLVFRMPVLDSNNIIIGSQGIMFDITDLKHTEQELIQSKEKAEESDRLKSAFLTNMSHEIRTPMSTVLGFADLLKEPNLTGEEQQLYIQSIEQSGARMLNTLSDIICISKIESGQMTVTLSETDINVQIRRIYALFKPEAEEKGIKFIVKNSLAANEVVFKTDGEKINAILSNLVNNALKFTRAGFIEIEYLMNNKEIEFRIKDSGTGVRPELKAFIFENFRQGSEAYTRDYEGAGLGLSISKAYVEMLGGKIWVESELGKGATFLFTVPIVQV